MLVSLCWPATFVAATDYHVSKASQFADAVKQAKPGDAIVLTNGQWQDVDLLFDAQGTAEQPITLRAQSPGQVVISGNSRLRIAGRHLIVSGLLFRNAWHSDELVSFRRDSKRAAEYCQLTNCAIIDCNPPNKDRESKYVSIYGSYNRVDHCLLEGKTNRGTTLVAWLSGEPNHHRIDHNYFGPRKRLGENGGETIRVGDSKYSLTDSRTIVEQNLFVECDGEAEIISSKSCENIYRYNTFRRCSGALTLRHGNRCVVEGNFFLGEKARGSGGVRIIGEDHQVYNNYFEQLEGDEGRAALSMMNGLKDSPLNGYFTVKRATVAFNTLVDCKESLVIGITDDDAKNRLPPEDCTFANNLVYSRRGPLVSVLTPPLRFTWHGNLMGGAAVGVSPTSGIRTVDSQPLEERDGLWRITPKSLAYQTAVGDFDFVQEDIDGHRRDDRKDVGCDQWSQAPIARQPLTAANVGPDWWGRTSRLN